MCASYMLARISLFNITRARVIVGVVDLYFISRARFIYGREYCWSGQSLLNSTSVSYIWAGILLERSILLYITRARLTYERGIFLGWLKILKCIFTVLPYLYMGGEYFWGVDLYFISCAREL